MTKPTVEISKELQEAFEHFNRTLFEREFGNSLPDCVITLQRRRNTKGFFSAEQFIHLGESSEVRHEIALNPQHFGTRDVKEILSTLVHEMVHLWQQEFGKPGRARYHNLEFAQRMEDLGLKAFNVNDPDRVKVTGDSVDHSIIPGGKFDKAADRLLNRKAGFAISWSDRSVDSPDSEKEKTSGQRTKYSCPKCDLAAWAKSDAHLKCGDCDLRMKPAE